jgi:hypothetical protein
MDRPFLRDVIFYIGAAYWTFYIFYKGVVTTWEAIGQHFFMPKNVIIKVGSKFQVLLCSTWFTLRWFSPREWQKFPKHN